MDVDGSASTFVVGEVTLEGAGGGGFDVDFNGGLTFLTGPGRLPGAAAASTDFGDSSIEGWSWTS